MEYSNIEGIVFPWTYDKLMDLPIFMIREIYEQLDKHAERLVERKRQMSKSLNH